MRMAWLVIIGAVLAGCGSGSTGGSGTDGNAMLPVPVPGTARVVLSTQGPTPDTILYAVQFTLRLPLAVSLPPSDGDGLLPAGVLQAAPSGSFAGASYLPATTDTGPVLQVNIFHPGGFTVGPLATLNCNVAVGAEASASGFTVDGFSARDANGAPLPGITPHLALLTQ